jgi:hypothetical protein
VRPPDGIELPREADAALVVMSESDIGSSVPLLYYPGETNFTDPWPTRSSPVNGWNLRKKNLASALDSYRDVAGSRDRAVRASALGRMARVARKLDRPKMALEAYDALAALGRRSRVGAPRISSRVSSGARCCRR